MRGLPFPSETLFNREQSLDFGSPVPNGAPVLTDVVLPLDPALGGPSSAPPYYPPVNGVNGQEIHSFNENGPIHQYPYPPSYTFEQYAQGPQGDPFAPPPPPPPMYYHDPAMNHLLDDQEQVSQKPLKRKRKPRREKDCGFCGGNNSRNREKKPEHMVTCSDCGRSGHPTCMELGDIGETLRGYEWKCIECKTCEICSEKGDDERILFCDNCDRGWHTYCLNPPLKENPEGEWFCPLCIQPKKTISPDSEFPPNTLVENDFDSHTTQPMIDPALQVEMALDIDPMLREQSVASSSFIPEPRQSRGRGRPRKSEKDRKGKAKAMPRVADTDEEDGDIDMDVEESLNISPSKSRNSFNRRKSAIRSRRRSESIVDDIDAPSPPPRPPKRSKFTVVSPSPPPQQRPNSSRRPKIRLRLPGTKGKGRGEEEEEEDSRKGLFDDVLDEKQRDTSKTTILSSDKERFEKARVVAETKLIPPPPSEAIDLLSASGPSTGRFPLRSAIHQLQQQQQSLLATPRAASPTPSTPGPYSKNDPSVLRIRTIRFGPFDIQTWYDAPFPEEFSNIPEGRLWICEFCLKYMKSRFGAQRHRLKCKCRHPPGDEIYRDGSISIFEVDGRRNKIYCQNLCLLSKMFLDHKSLFYDVEPFLFYVMTEVDDIGAHFVGYFSKEKKSSKDLNLSCIMTLPVRQRQGWGNLLIDFSYLLSRKEQRSGTPERPLSALGAIGYKKYWTLALMRYLQNAPDSPRLEDISISTGMNLEDIYITLVQQNMIAIYEDESAPVRPSPGRSIKINRRRSGFTRKNIQKTLPKNDDKTDNAPFVPPTNYCIDWDRLKVERFLEDWKSKGYLILRPEKLKWTPFLLSREDKLMPALGNALADMQVDAESTPTIETGENTLRPVSRVNSSADATDNVMTVDNIEQQCVIGNTEGTEVIPSTPKPTIELVEQELERSVTEDEDDSSSSPPPTNTYKPMSSNRLEALAALACVVQKANPVDPRRRQVNVTTFNDRGSPRSDELVNGSAISKLSRSGPIDSGINSRPNEGSGKIWGKPHNEVAAGQLHPRIQSPRPGTMQTSSVEPITHDSLEKDAEYAAQLAREEGLGRRSLRSTSTSIPATPTLSSREIRTKDISRKRRKASPVRDQTPPILVTPDRPTTRRQAQALAIETAKASRLTRRQSSKLAENAGDNDLYLTSPASVRSSRRNGISKASATPSPSKPVKTTRNNINGNHRSKKSKKSRSRRHASPSIHSESVSELRASFNESVSDVDAEGESDIDAEGEPDNGSTDEIEENMDIVSGIDLSMRNVGLVAPKGPPSVNTTVFSPLVIGIGQMTMNIGIGNEDVKPVTEVLSNGNLTVVPDNGMVVNADIEEEDIDAEGEPDDEDADGEPDPDLMT